MNEIKKLQKIAGILKEDDDFDLSYNPLKPDSRILVYTHGNGDLDFYGDQYNAEEVSQIISKAYSSGDEEVKITKITDDFYLVEIDGGVFTYSVIGPKFQYAKKIFSLVDADHEVAAEDEIINFLRRAKHLEEDDNFDLSDNPLKPDSRILVYNHNIDDLDFYPGNHDIRKILRIHLDFFRRNGVNCVMKKLAEDLYEVETQGGYEDFTVMGIKAPNAKQIFSLVDSDQEALAIEELKKVINR